MSLLCVLLRKKLVELDAAGGETRLILSREQIVEMLRIFFGERSNEAKLVDQIDGHIAKVVEFGFLRRLKKDEDQFEVRRIIKALVDGDWLAEIDRKLEEYRTYADASA